TIDFASKSKRLIQDVQHLLLRFGINARVCRQSTGHYRLFIHGTAPCRTFLQEIGLLGRKYVEDATAYLAVFEGLANPNLDTVPPQIGNRLELAAVTSRYAHVAALVKAERGATYKTSRRSVLRGQSMSRSRLLRLAELADDADLQCLAQSDL